MSYDNMNNESDQSAWKIRAESLYADRDIFHPTTTKKFPLGAQAESRDGRKWRYQQNGAGVLVKALGQQAAVEIAGWVDEVQTDNPDLPSVGDKLLMVNLTTTAVKDEFVDAYLWVEEGTGEGEMYLVKGNKAGVANTEGPSGCDILFEIADQCGLREAYIAAATISIKVNPYKDVIVFPTDPTGICTGIAHTAVAAESYFWGQVHGPCVVMNGTDSIVTGDWIEIGGQAEGVCSLHDDGTAFEGSVQIGYAIRAAASSEAALIFLTIE